MCSCSHSEQLSDIALHAEESNAGLGILSSTLHDVVQAANLNDLQHCSTPLLSVYHASLTLQRSTGTAGTPCSAVL